MKLIVAGATGFVATEVIRQSLRTASITSVIALARRPVSVPEDLESSSDPSKLKTVVLQDFGAYPEDIKQQLAGADACIWTLAITPSKSRSLDFAEVTKVCHDYTLAGLRAIFEARNQSDGRRPFRFVYMSGSSAERDQTATPRFLAEYCLMRGRVENDVLAFAAEHKGEIEVCSVKPGIINEPGVSIKSVLSTVAGFTGIFPKILVTEVSAAMIDQAMNGFEKEPLTNDDLVRIGQRVLKENS